MTLCLVGRLSSARRRRTVLPRSPLHLVRDSMTDIVPTEDIERIVGVERHATEHWARAVSAEKCVYILHSHECLNSGVDLRECRFSRALDNGIRVSEWVEDEALPVAITGAFNTTRLVPDGT